LTCENVCRTTLKGLFCCGGVGWLVSFLFKLILYSIFFLFNCFRVYSYSSRFCLSESLEIRDWSKSVGEEIGLVEARREELRLVEARREELRLVEARREELRLVEARREELRLVEITGDASIKVRSADHSGFCTLRAAEERTARGR